ncbi:MAG: hypothetical protein K2Y29_10435 [Beijerinckiaceae bacterium]|nr:hypothetical protein [Beijerinckiaceae bacterium]
MRNFGLALAAGLAIACGPVAAAADDVPFAQAPSTAGYRSELVPTLGDIMGATQLRHIKLWFAGKSGNWSLALYEIQQIKDSFDKSAILYSNIPVDLIVGANEPLKDMRSAAQAKSGKDFIAAYARLTASCNQCHDAGGVGFIRIQTPGASPFSNQLLSLPGK